MWGDRGKSTYVSSHPIPNSFARLHLYPRVLIRDTNRDGVFQLVFTGPEVQFDALKAKQSVEAVQAEVERITTRTDLRVKDITWQGEWR